MPWNERNAMSLRKEFVMQAAQEGSNISQLCERYSISRRVGYKWLNRYLELGDAGLSNKSRKPNHSPGKTEASMQMLILDTRKAKPYWGARKIYHWLKNEGYVDLPSITTIHRMIDRNNMIWPEDRHATFKRFEHERPNDLWQIDYKGHFAIDTGRCHPLTIIDDHSRFSPGVFACSNEQTETVKHNLTTAFRHYGLPCRINFDNGTPWSSGAGSCSVLGAWLIRLGIQIGFSRPYHPQTNGKVERFHRTLKAELLRHQYFKDLMDTQKNIDRWLSEYNLQRPHEALDMKPPISRYRVSCRVFPEQLPEVCYDSPEDTVRKVCHYGFVKFKSRKIMVSKVLARQYVALRPATADGEYDVYYCHQKLNRVNLNNYTKLKRWEP